MKKYKLAIYIILLILASYNFSFAFDIKITDGDTITLKGEKIRFFGIDAPEMKQICKNEFKKNYNCGIESKKALERAILEKLPKPKNLNVKYEPNNEVWCITKGKDRYKRILGICAVEHNDLLMPINDFTLNAWMVRNGYAVAYNRYSKLFIEFEEEAKTNKPKVQYGNAYGYLGSLGFIGGSAEVA